MGSGRAEIASQMRRRRLAALMIALAVAPLFATVTQAKAAAAPSAGSLSYAYATSNGTAHYRVFTPSSYRAGTAVPLVVVIHGCGLSASDEEAATLYDRVAQRFGFVVAYPDNDFGSHPGGCWQFYNKSATSGDIPVIVGMTRAVMRIRSIDRTRVYAIGTSSGGLLTSDLAAYNPRLYAAIGLMAGGPFGPDLCLTSQVSPLSVLSSASSEAAAAFRAEGAKRRVIPFIVLNGDADHVVSPQCGADAVQQWVRADNLSRSGGQDSPYRLSPIITQHRLPAVPG
ncbi:MAG TPA: PHB depolymerase family esterase, partial [Marmoricola sp.]|nr:PHB depolymerase family esterase [Marmoricola sp.]